MKKKKQQQQQQQQNNELTKYVDLSDFHEARSVCLLLFMHLSAWGFYEIPNTDFSWRLRVRQ